MKVHRISLRNYRGVTEADVSFAETGVTIVEGDNEVGKSSLAEALRLVLDERDSSTKARVRAVLPVGRDVAAEVEVELSTGPYHFTYAKRWGRKPGTVLSVATPVRRQLTGREAHEQVQAMLAETLDADLFAALHLEQGGGAGPVHLAVRSLGEALDRAAGTDRSGEREDALWDRIVAERDRYWTAHGRPRPDRVALAERVATAEHGSMSLATHLATLDRQTEELARLDLASAALVASQADLDRAATESAERARVVEALQGEVTGLTSRHEALASEAANCLQQRERRDELVERASSGAERLADAVARQAQVAPLLDAAAETHGALAREHDEATDALRRAEAHHRVAAADEDYSRRLIEVEQLTERRDRVVAEQATLDAAEAVVEITSVDAAALAAIEAAHLGVVQGEAAAAAAGAQVHLLALTATEVEIAGDVRTLAVGEQADLALGSERSLELTLPGVVTVTVQPGEEGQALAERAAAARRELARACAEAGVADLGQARRDASERAEAWRDRDLASRAIKDNLRDLTLDALGQKVARLTARIETYRSERVVEPALPADLDGAQITARSTASEVDRCRAELERIGAQLTRVAAQLNQAKVDDAGLGAEVGHARAALDQDNERLAAVRHQVSDEELTVRSIAADRAVQAAAAVLGQRQAELARCGPDTAAELMANAVAAQARGGRAIDDHRDQRRQLQVLLEVQGEQGLAAQHDQAVTDHRRLAHELDRLEAQAQAALVLHDTFAARRAEARNRYVGPFRSRIEQLGRLVFGPDLEVELGPDLQVTHRTLGGVTVAFDQLSTGAREQLGLLSRLACASIVAGPDGAPVVFDDALGWTDPGRLTQMAAAISLAARTCQVIVFTCTPGRYAGVGNATVVRLPTGVALPAAASA